MSVPEETNPADGSSIRLFQSRQEWADWLKKNHRTRTGLWLRVAKKGSGLQSVSYQEALEVALCYGWIDGQKRPESEQAWLQRFLARSSKSVWSKINREKALVLIASGEMNAAGLEAIENAKRNGRWDSAYDSPSGATVPSDFQAALDANPRASAFFGALDRANRYAILWRIQTGRKPRHGPARLSSLLECWSGKRRFIPDRPAVRPWLPSAWAGATDAGPRPPDRQRHEPRFYPALLSS